MTTWQVVIVLVIGLPIMYELEQAGRFLREIRDEMVAIRTDSEEGTKILGLIQSDIEVVRVLMKKQGDRRPEVLRWCF
jgi:hypothetical protein